MSNSLEPLLFYVGKSFVDRAKKVFSLGFIVRKPLLQILRSMGVQLVEMDRDETKRALEEFSRTSGITITYAQLLKEITLSMLTPTALLRAAKGETITFLGTYDLGFSMFIEIFTAISRAFRPTINTYIWLVIPKSSEGSGKAIQLLRDIRDRVGVLPITPDEWEAVQPVTEKLSKSGFTVKGLTENLWVSI
ncbi:MAG: hypothetical protein RMJ00_00355 [Nitrososphaerota archaeon]|nr:hypothetical protein [Candidatus Bathyarchaeota archaeon]MCX8162620.1 hypothetical protein [Candidatus Bathyarchaeota archaeon]MDW8061142.1 hypothetical protein [Nitrososphaerota archaeon]